MEKPNISSHCEQCASTRIARIVYDFPDRVDSEHVDHNTVVLPAYEAAHEAAHGAAQWYCTGCHHEWGVNEREASHQWAEQDTRARALQKEADAIARGVLHASVTADGIVRCPHCRRSFDTCGSLSWDGQRHTTCGTYLQLGAAP